MTSRYTQVAVMHFAINLAQAQHKNVAVESRIC